MRTTTKVLAALLFSFGTLAQNVLIFQPSGGANDGTDQGGINSGKDTWVNRFNPGDNNGDLYINYASPRSTCNTSDTKSYFQFDVSMLPSLVDSVKFGVTHLEHTSYCYSNCAADFYFFYCTTPWDEMSLVQNNLPSESASPFYGPIPISFPNNFGNVEYDITSAYNYWKDTTNINYGFTVYSTTVGCNNASVAFYNYSSDDSVVSNRPYLKIYYPSQAGTVENELLLSAYPNPFSEYLKIDLNGIEKYYLTDIMGRKLNVDYYQDTKQFNTANLEKGVYFLYLEAHGKYSVIKLIKN